MNTLKSIVTVVLIIFCFSSVMARAQDDALIAHYKLDGNLNDEMGLSDGLYAAGADPASKYIEGNDGTPNGALLFGDQSDTWCRVDLGTYSPIQMGTDGSMTLAFYAYWNGNNGTYQDIINKRDDWNDAGMVWGIGQHERFLDVLSIWRGGGGDREALCTEGIPLQEWTHVAFTIDGNDVKFYINGEYVNTADYEIGSGFEAMLHVGCSPNGQGDSFNGALDDIRFYSRNLTDEEITAIVVEEPAPRQAALVVGNPDLSTSFDGPLFDRLVALGYEVTVYDDANVDNSDPNDPNLLSTTNASAYDVVVISESCGSSAVTELAYADVPIMDQEAYGWSRKGYTTDEGKGWGPVVTLADIMDDTHPITAGAGLSGQVLLFDEPGLEGTVIDVAGMAVDAVSLVQVPDSNQVLVWVIEQGGVLATGDANDVAVNRICGFGLIPGSGTYDVNLLTVDGWALFDAAIAWLNPAPVNYTFDGDAAVYGAADSDDSLDGTWDHNNGSDQWDGSGIGEGAPGGVAALVEEDVTFLRIQDTGNPTSYGVSDPSNRKLYLTHALGCGLDGVSIEFSIRIATTAPLDAMADGTPWPEGGMSGLIMDRGKGMVGIGDRSMGGMVSFSLALAGNDGAEGSDMLLMNALNGQAPADEVDTGQGVANAVPIADATAWNTVSATIVAGGTGTHVVTVSVNGGEAQSFDVTVGTKYERSDNTAGYIGIGSSGTGAMNGFDIDYISVKSL